MSKDFGKGSRQKRKKCVKPTAYPCKYACILKTKNCRNPLKGQAATAVQWVADQDKRLAETNKKRARAGLGEARLKNGYITADKPVTKASDRPTTKLIKTDNHAEIKQILEDGTNGTLEQLQAREKRADKLRDTLLDEIKSIENQHRLFTDSEINWFNKKGFEDISRKIQGTGGVYIYEDGEYKLRGISKAQKGVGYGPRASATKEGPTGTFVIKDLSDNSTRSVYGSDILRNDTPKDVLEDLLNKRQFRRDLLKVSKEIENKIFQLQSEPNSADELAARRKPTQEQTGSKVVSLSDRQAQKNQIPDMPNDLEMQRAAKYYEQNPEEFKGELRNLLSVIEEGRSDLHQKADKAIEDLNQRLADQKKDAEAEKKYFYAKQQAESAKRPETRAKYQKIVEGYEALQKAKRNTKRDGSDAKVVSLTDRQAKKDSTRNSDRVPETKSTVTSLDDKRTESKLKKGDVVGVLDDAIRHSEEASDIARKGLQKLDDLQNEFDQKVDSVLKKYPLIEDNPKGNTQPAKPKDIETLTAEEARLGKELDAILNKYTGKKTTAQQEEINKAKEAYIKANKALREAKKNLSFAERSSRLRHRRLF